MLAEALASVRAQTFTDYEVIVVSNGERDGMRALSRACAERHGAVFLELPVGNVSAARNHAVAHAQCEWIAFIDDDDIWLPHKLERQMADAVRTGADMIACDFVEFFPDGSEAVSVSGIRDGWPFTKAINHQRWGAIPSAVIVRKAALDATGGFDPKQRCCEDIDLWRRIAWRHAIHQMDCEAMVRYRRHPDTASRRWIRLFRYDLRFFLKMLRDTPPDLRWAVPRPSTFVRRLLLRTFTPPWLRQPKKSLSDLGARLRTAMTTLAVFSGR
jgi:glycosyltransferase involved in cell wall biosynthesis